MKRNKFGFFVFCIILLSGHSFMHAQTVTVEMDSVRQLIRGFGGIHINAWQGTELNEDLQEKAFENDPGELGLSILRLQVSDDTTQFGNELDIARYAVSKGAIVFASPWNAPAELLDPSASQSVVLYSKYGEYADHLNRYIKFMNDSGVPLYAMSVQNEPDYGNWTRWTAEEMRTFVNENGGDIQTRLMAPESFQFRRDYTDVTLNDAGAAANLDIVGGHIYGGGLFDYPLARELGKEVWMTEHYTSSDRSANLWPDALLVGSEITDCMQANFNAYVWWFIRRFYGFITDDGLISKRGYVMSQFSKFVRPDAYRVDVTLDAAPNVDATAFRTDTSLVVVVVNSNDSEVNLDFTIENNIGIDTLTQFSTSETKNMVNDGGIKVTGDAFSVSVDGNSITTLTSWAGYGGRYGNIPPVAVAGEDTTIVDSLGIGLFDIVLDASASTDTDGEIVNINWSVDERQVSWDTVTTYQFGIGEHIVVLAVTDNDGARDIDTLVVTVRSPFSTEIWMDAECAIVGSNWEINANAEASNGYYVNTPAGHEFKDTVSTDTADYIIFNFEISESGPYKVWGRTIVPNADDDSYWVHMDDDTEWVAWNGIVGGSSWQWDDVHNWNDESPVTWQLEEGEHTLRICMREDGALLDKIYITNTGATPEGVGETDPNCPVYDNVPAELSKDFGLTLYPNPANDRLFIHVSDRLQEGSRMEIIDIRGQAIFSNSVSHHDFQVDISGLSEGIYLVVLKDGTHVETARFIKEK